MRKTIIAGNWKMHLNTHQASILMHRLEEHIEAHRDVEVVVFPSMMNVQPLSMQIKKRKMKVGAQDAFYEDEGAYTGEVSAAMLHSVVDYCLVGHSERRHVFGESDDIVGKKLAAVVRNKISPVLCVGETSAERAANETKQVLHDQIMSGLRNLTAKEVEEMTIAYEPVWAIGTGDFAKPEQVKDAIDTIRHNVRESRRRSQSSLWWKCQGRQCRQLSRYRRL
jgi:triosephosphate isomerase